MPWSETSVMDQKMKFVADWMRGRHTMSELCALYGISRKSAYKWIDRYMNDGPDWAMDRSHEAAVVHNKTPVEVEQALMQMRLRHRTWGARKLLHQVGLEQPQLILPQESTVCDMLKRNGLITVKPRRRSIGQPGRTGNHGSGLIGPSSGSAEGHAGKLKRWTRLPPVALTRDDVTPCRCRVPGHRSFIEPFRPSLEMISRSPGGSRRLTRRRTPFRSTRGMSSRPENRTEGGDG